MKGFFTNASLLLMTLFFGSYEITAQCTIFDIIAEPHECEPDGTFFIDLAFDFDEVGDSGFKIQGNGTFYGEFEYAALPITLGPLEGNGTTIYEFVVTDLDYADCNNWTAIDPVECDGVGDCHLFDMEYEHSDCDADGNFTLTLNFEFQGVGDEGFALHGNGEDYGIFSYSDLPISLTLPGDGTTPWEFVATDVANPDCEDFVEVGVINCAATCQILSLELFPFNCKTENSHELEIHLEVENASGDYVTLSHQGEIFGVYALDEFPVFMGNFYGNDDPAPVITACILGTDCCLENFFETPNCPGASDCFISPITVETSNCNGDGNYNLTIDFETEAPGNDFFEVFHDDAFLGFWLLSDLPVTIENFSGSDLTLDQITVCINDQQHCCRQVVFETPPCVGNDCNIWDVYAEAHDCNGDGNYLVDIEFQSENVGEEGFSILANDLVFGPFEYGEIFYTFGPIPDETFYELVIVDNQYEDCSGVFFMQPISCDGDCEILHLEVELVECNDDGTYSLWLDFEVENATNTFFDLKVGDELLGFFSLDELPLLIESYPASGNPNDHLTVCINDNPNCCKTIEFEALECDTEDCHIWDLVAEAHPCDTDGNFLVDIAFNAENVGNDGYTIKGNGMNYGSFSYDEPFVTVGPIAGDGTTIYEFIVVDNQFEDCKTAIGLGPIDCNDDCDIAQFNVEAGACNDDGTYPIWLNFEVLNPTQNHFDLIYNGEIIGFYSLDELPLEIPHFEGIGEPFEVMTVCINDNPNCCATVGFEAPNCTGGQDCLIEAVQAEFLECDGDQYYISLNFEYQGVGTGGFSVLGNGNNYGDFEYDALPITIGPLTAGEMIYEFVVIDNQKPNCQNWTGFGPYFCDGECHITNVHAVPADDCENGEFYVWLNFNTENIGDDGFTVVGNGNDYGEFSYDDLPILIGPLAGDGMTVYEFIVNDVSHPDCGGHTHIEPVSCGDDCEIFEVEVDPLECNDDGTYGLFLNFEWAGATSDWADILIGDELIASFPLNELPHTITHFPNSGTAFAHLTICLNEGECCETIEFENLECPDFDLVWPGDANDDNIANHFDLLHIGLAFNAEGFERDVQGIEWTGLEGLDWNQTFENGVNFKHADCVGTGIVSGSDVEAIELNYGSTHGVVAPYEPVEPSESDPPFFVDLPDSEDITFGQPFEAPIILGTESSFIEDIYGIAFTLHFDPDLIDPASIDLTYDPSWLGVFGVNLLTIDKTFANEGQVQVALSRVDHNNVSGFGQIAKFIGIIDNIAGKEELIIEITDVKAIQNNETQIPLRTPIEVVELVTSTTNPIANIQLSIYPNPTSDWLIIKNNLNLDLDFVQITDASGRVLTNLEQPNYKISFADFATGVYFLKVQVDGKWFYERVVKL